MKYTITDHRNLINSLKEQFREGQTGEFIELIPSGPTNVGSDIVSRTKARKAEGALNAFRDSLHRITNDALPFSILACICSLPENLESLPEGCNKDDFFDIFLWLLSDTGFLFDEARPDAKGQYPVEDLYAALDEKNRALDDAKQLESTIISGILSAFHDKYRHLSERDEDVPSILRRMEDLTGEKDWFQRCLLQTFSTKRSRIDCSKEELAANWINNSNLSAEQLLEKLRIDTLFQPLRKPSKPEAIAKDIELFIDLCGFYANIYKKRCTNEVKSVWNAVFLIYSGYQGLYLKSRASTKGQPSGLFPSCILL